MPASDFRRCPVRARVREAGSEHHCCPVGERRQAVVNTEQMKQAVHAALSERETREPLRTLDDVRALSRDEINERWDEVQVVLEAPQEPQGNDAA